MHHTLEDLIERGERQARRLREIDLRKPLAWIEDRLPEIRRPTPARAEPPVALWPALLLAAGTGAAVYWWMTRDRGRGETAADAEGAAHPERVMAHTAAPAGAEAEVVDDTAGELAEPAEQIMAHHVAPTSATGDPAPPKSGRSKPSAGEAGLLASVAPAGLGDVDAHLSAETAPSLDAALAAKPARRARGPGKGAADGIVG